MVSLIPSAPLTEPDLLEDPDLMEDVGASDTAGNGAAGDDAAAPQGWRSRLRHAAHWGGALLDWLLPPVCLACHAPASEPGQLCAPCWGRITFLAPPACACCGLPFGFEAQTGALCAACLGHPPAFDRARAAMLYDDASRSLILGFKHGDRLEATGPLAAWMARAGADLLAGDPVLVPVPLHRARLIKRRYNQSALLARTLARTAGVDWAPLALKRRRATRSQHGLSATGRRRNVTGAFCVAAGQADALAGRRVVLIDDVMTTGATVEACARVLRRAGVDGVDVLTAARTRQPRPIL